MDGPRADGKKAAREDGRPAEALWRAVHPQFAVLLVLCRASPMTADRIAWAILGSANFGLMRPDTGTLYNAIHALVRSRLVKVVHVPRQPFWRGRTAKYYAPTDAGRAVNAATVALLRRMLDANEGPPDTLDPTRPW